MITKHNISQQEYFALEGLSFSTHLKHLIKHTCKPLIEQKETDAMKFGTALHCAILEPEVFENTYYTTPELLSDFKNELNAIGLETKGINSWEKALALLGKDGINIKQDEYDLLQLIAKNTNLQDAFGGDIQAEVTFTTHKAGYDLKGRLDILAKQQDGSYVIGDIKTFAFNKDKNGTFKQQAFNTILYNHYWLQSAYYEYILQDKYNISDIKFMMCDKTTGQVMIINIPSDLRVKALLGVEKLLAKLENTIDLPPQTQEELTGWEAIVNYTIQDINDY